MHDVGMVKELYERYVDDINNCVKETEVGARYIGGQLVYLEETKKEDEGKATDLRTFEVIQQIGNSIHPSIQVEVDVPSNYPDKKLPMLDLRVWTAKVTS